jgi:hypothetical protein
VVPLGEVETDCEFCGSELRMLPGKEELEVVRTREEMKKRERVEVQRHALDQRFKREEYDRWRQAAGKVAIAAMPVIGDAAGRAVLRGAMHRGGGGCCGCLGGLLALGAGLVGLLALL